MKKSILLNMRNILNTTILVGTFCASTQAFAFKSFQFSCLSAVSVLSVEGSRLENPMVMVVGKNLNGATVEISFTYDSPTSKECLGVIREAVSSKKKVIINVSDTPHNGEQTVFGCATGDGNLPIPVN